MGEERTNFYDDGVEVDMGFGKKVCFFPLSWGAQRRLREEMKIVFGGDRVVLGTEAWTDAVGKVLFASASRGNPGLTEEQFLEMLDPHNAPACFHAMAAASGTRKDEKEAGDTPHPTLSPNGATSMPPLSPPPDGVSSSVTN